MGEHEDGLTVGRTAELVGVSVRTLHHWDEIGLVHPSARTWAGYRLYTGADIARLQHVLVYRELGMPLARIGRLIDDPGADVAWHLEEQRRLLVARVSRLQELILAVDTMKERQMTDKRLTPEEQAQAYGAEWNDPYYEEAKEKYGATDAWAQSQERTKSMTKEDWEQARAELDDLESALADAKRQGVEPGTEAAAALAERHRESLDRWFDVGHARQVLIATNYVDDPRFAAHYDDREPGLAAWLKAVIDENARAHGVDPETASWD